MVYTTITSAFHETPFHILCVVILPTRSLAITSENMRHVETPVHETQSPPVTSPGNIIRVKT